MATDPKKARDDGSERRPGGAESKGDARGASGGSRSNAGSDYGDWVPDRPQHNDDRDAGDPQMGDYPTGGGDMTNVARQPGSPQAESDRAHAGTKRTGVAGEQERIDAEAEAIAESNRNKDFDTTHVHSSTTSRKV
jgi:hypothetical protein